MIFLIKEQRWPMRLSARNILKGTIVDVTKGQTTAHVRIDIGGTIGLDHKRGRR